MKQLLCTIIFCISLIAFSQDNKPKLVVGIVVDQMRYDYLTRFEDQFTAKGFKRLLNDGFNCKNTHYNYVPTYTGPGHASIFTGTTPANHGVISNNWYEKFSNTTVYCASDETVNVVGCKTTEERMSPRRLKTTTVADQLQLHSQNKAKTIGIAIKDRGAILPAGHTATAAYWFRGRDVGKWITSTYYTNELPSWVIEFNKTVEQNYLKTWNLLLSPDSYTVSGPDNNKFEGLFKGKDTPTFPYDLKALSKKNKGFDVIKASPFGNTLTADFAIAAIKNENLGKDNVTDFLTVSFSSTDYIGHQFGVNSVEVQDTYLRLDRDLERLFNALDDMVGKGNYTVFLTADHGAVQVPNFLASQKIPSGYFDKSAFSKALNKALEEEFETDNLIANISNNQIFLNKTVLANIEEDQDDIETFIANTIIDFKHIDKVYTRETLMTTDFVDGIGALIQNGFHHKHSGDVIFVLEPAVISYPETGSTHGSGLSYDTHVPLLFYGNGIPKGKTYRKVNIVDIAPTISAMLGISFPNGSTGTPIQEILE